MVLKQNEVIQMIKIKLDKNRWNQPVFYLKVDEEDKNHVLLRRAIMEGARGKDGYDYKIPTRFFTPIFKNYPKEKIEVSKSSIKTFLEFTDDFGETYQASTVATPSYMKKWREASCPNIYKIEIEEKDKRLNESIAFKKISNVLK